MILDPKVLEAAGVRTPEYWADHIAQLTTPETRRKEIIHAIKSSVRDTIAAADLVPRSEIRKGWQELMDERDEACRLAAENGKMIAALREAGESLFEWLAINARHAPSCKRSINHIVPDGAHHSGLAKDYGGRYATDEELSKIPCTCGFDKVHRELCLALSGAAAAAAQWVRVDDGWSEFVSLVVHACREASRWRMKDGSECWCNRGQPTHSPGCKALAAVYEKAQELLAPAAEASEPEAGSMTADDARKGIARIMADPAYFNANHPEHDAKAAEAQRLFQLAHPAPKAGEPEGEDVLCDTLNLDNEENKDGISK